MFQSLRPLWKKLRGEPRSSSALDAEFVNIELQLLDYADSIDSNGPHLFTINSDINSQNIIDGDIQ